MPAWAAVRATARAELRARRRGLVGLGLLLGLVGGVVLGAVVVAERTATAYPRLVAATQLDDARVLVPFDRPRVAAALPTLPGVDHVRTSPSWIGQVDGPSVRYVSFGTAAAPAQDVFRPVVVQGRAPRPDAADEAFVSELLAEDMGLRVGDTMTVHLLLPAEVARFDVGFGAPDGGVAVLHVVGVGRAPAWNGLVGTAQVTPAFAAAHPAEVVGDVGLVRLRATDAATRAAFAAGLTAVDDADPTRSVLAAYLRAEPTFPSTDVDPAVRTAELVLVSGLAVFAAVAWLSGLLVAGQALQRHHAAGRHDQRIERALGLTLGERVLARVGAGGVGAVVAGLVAAALALAAGFLPPLGSQARFEPAPGFRPQWGPVVGGGLVVALIFLGLTAGAAVAAARRPRPMPPSPATGPYTLLGGRPTVLAGVGVARHGLRGGDGWRTVVAVAGLTAAVTGVVAAAAFGASLQRLVDTPARYGEAGDLTVADAREPDVAALVADPRVTALSRSTSADVVLGADATPSTVVAVEARKGALPVETVTGAPPARPGEVALGVRTAARLGLDVGDTLAVGSQRLQVTGVVVFATDGRRPLGEGAMVVPAQLDALADTPPTVSAVVRAAPGQAPALLAELGARLEVYPVTAPAEVENLADLTGLPELLAAVLAAVAGAGLVHTLLGTGRRHGRDLAVLAVLGATPRQVLTTLAVASAVTVLPALLVGVPLGLGVARVVWWQVATGVGTGGDLAVPAGLLVATGPVLLLGALLASAVPGVRATRTWPAAVLAAE